MFFDSQISPFSLSLWLFVVPRSFWHYIFVLEACQDTDILRELVNPVLSPWVSNQSFLALLVKTAYADHPFSSSKKQEKTDITMELCCLSCVLFYQGCSLCACQQSKQGPKSLNWVLVTPPSITLGRQQTPIKTQLWYSIILQRIYAFKCIIHHHHNFP
jgi:hypothetical protein